MQNGQSIQSIGTESDVAEYAEHVDEEVEEDSEGEGDKGTGVSASMRSEADCCEVDGGTGTSASMGDVAGCGEEGGEVVSGSIIEDKMLLMFFCWTFVDCLPVQILLQESELL